MFSNFMTSRNNGAKMPQYPFLLHGLFLLILIYDKGKGYGAPTVCKLCFTHKFEV